MFFGTRRSAWSSLAAFVRIIILCDIVDGFGGDVVVFSTRRPARSSPAAIICVALSYTIIDWVKDGVVLLSTFWLAFFLYVAVVRINNLFTIVSHVLHSQEALLFGLPLPLFAPVFRPCPSEF